MTRVTESVGQKEIREIKLEQLEDMVLAMETFVLLIAITIGGKNMEQEPLIILVDYINRKQ